MAKIGPMSRRTVAEKLDKQFTEGGLPLEPPRPIDIEGRPSSKESDVEFLNLLHEKHPEKAKDWVTRTDPNDLSTVEINLAASPDLVVPMVLGQTIGRVTITETRLYSIRELRAMVFGTTE